MRDFDISVDIDAPPQRVWHIMTAIESWSEWTASITSVERLDPGVLRPGMRARIVQPKFPPAIWKVTEVVDGESFAWVSQGPGIEVIARHLVTPRSNGSTATLTLHFNGPLGGVFGRITANINNRYLALEAAGLKRRSETGPVAHIL